MRILKILTLIGLLLFPILTPASDDNVEAKTVLDLDGVCEFIAVDGIALAMMYQDGLSKEDIALKIAERNEREPAMVFAMPGVIRMLFALEMTVEHQPDLLEEEDFAVLFGLTVKEKCIGENADGWVQDVPGKAKVIYEKSPKKYSI